MTDPGKCHARGWKCWERVVQEADSPEDTHLSPLSLLATLDYLDATWRGAPWKPGRLFKHRHAETIADLAQPCTTRSDFRDRIGELDNVLKSMEIPDNRGYTDAVKSAGSLVRLKHFLVAQLDPTSSSSVAARTAIESAIARLLEVNRLRTAIQHPTTSAVDLTSAHLALGVSYPTADWTAAWRRVQHSIIEATRSLIDEISALS